MLQEFAEENIEPLATGAWILGTGGGGNPYISTLNLRRLYAEGRRVQVMDPMALEDDDMVAVVSKMGAPLVGQERLGDPVHLARAVEVMEDYLGKPFRAIMSVEIGGSNALSSFLAAAMLDRPVVNADAMGRAYPEAQMTSFAIGNLPMFPLSLVDVRDNEVIVTRAASWKWMERISRKVCTEVGSTAATCKAPRTGKEVKEWGIHYTVTKAVELGRAVMDARARHADPVQAVLDHEGGKQLFRGKVIDVARETTGGFLRGSTVIEGMDADKGSRMELAFQNEWAVAFRDGSPVAMTPDLLCLLDTVSGSAIGTESVRYGQRVTVVALPAPELLTTPAGIAAVGPRAFGYDIDFRSVFP
ncbi:DUF917 domain-containing protein [Rhizobium sp. CG4]|jgi:DUF917 family protein|uniref:DUF917 domain-containing protein n=1 Tax=Rhizobium/Agrobacterium group TaxID=227290 RepID=UPI0020339D48|nr:MULTISPECIES: DUF917 domain-containing protein [Rhizobium/Agrobacterium group]MCM2457764.1 DUF917 domain-containing protein [Rhizobium sp. CG4]MCS4243233.1 DUF917 family protein [Rhizobium sp. BIGb0125]MDO5897776.1 DUF917 domain-containing protein [Agrobacterium sp. Azo12]